VLTCRFVNGSTGATASVGKTRPVPKSTAGSGPQQRPGQGPVTKATFKMGHGGCVEVHVSNHPPLREALQQ